MKDGGKLNYAKERSSLLALGIPQDIVDHALSKRPAHWLYMLSAWSFIAIMCLGFLAGIFVWCLLEGIVDKNAFQDALSINGLMYDHNFGVSMLVALFGWIFAAGFIVITLLSLSKRFRASTFVYTFLDPKNTPYLALLKRSAERNAGETDPDEYMRKTTLGWGHIILWPAVFLFSVSAVIFEREAEAHTVFTAESYISTPLFPWETEKTSDWSNATYVELGCNHITGKGASDDIIYRVHFNDGSSISIDNAIPVSGAWIDQAEKIDATLVGLGVEFRRWKWLNRDPIHPLCLQAQQRRNGASAFKRIRALLRVGEFPTD